MRNEVGHVTGIVIQVGGDATIELPATIDPALSGLPRASAVFTGREADLAIVRSWPGWGVISGLAGIGKTELAIQAVDRKRFRGGVLFADLHGYDETRYRPPAATLDGLLRALGVPGEAIPPEEQDRSRLFKSVLSAFADRDRPILLILDNAAGLDQLTPLLPGDERTGLFVTSRETLAMLTAEFGARHLDLAVLDPAGASTLISPEDPAAGREIARLCGYLPLALLIVAALRVEGSSLAALERDLADERTRLDELDHPEKSVRASFNLSYRRLTGPHAETLRRFGLNPGPDIATPAMAALTAIPERTARRALEALARAHLVQRGTTEERWQLHDLVRLYATERAQVEDPRTVCDAAVYRLESHYLERTREAVTTMASTAGAATWLDAEYLNLVAIFLKAIQLGQLGYVARMALCLSRFVNWREEYSDLNAIAWTWVESAHWTLACLTAGEFAIALGSLGIPGIDMHVAGQFVEAFFATRHKLDPVQQALLSLSGSSRLVDPAQFVDRLSDEEELDLVMDVYRRVLEFFARAGDRKWRSINHAVDISCGIDDTIVERHYLTNVGKTLWHLGRVADFAGPNRIAIDDNRRSIYHAGAGCALLFLGCSMLELVQPADALSAFREASVAFGRAGHNENQRIALELVQRVLDYLA